MQDRFAELHDGVSIQVDDITLERPPFYERVKIIDQEIMQLSIRIKSISDLFSQTLIASPGELTILSNTLEKELAAVQQMIISIRTSLKNLYSDIRKLDPSDIQKKIQSNIHSVLFKKFYDLVQTYQEKQLKAKKKFNERISRQVKLVNPLATDEEIAEVISSGSANVFSDYILHSKAKDALVYVESKHREILLLEQSIRELHQLFVDMALLVDAQEEMLDVIQVNITNVAVSTKTATTEIKQANTHQRKSRKNFFILACIGVVVILFVIIMIFVFK